jgi:hypothetical protein
MPKLFLYKAKDADIIAILRRGENKRKEWQLILWNTDNDTFQEGQWLMNKMIHPRYCSISPNGEYFFYHYWNHGQYSEDAVFSKLPNFTAEYYGTWNTYYQDCSFTYDNKGVVSLENQFVKRKLDTNLELVLRKEIDMNTIVPCGYIGIKEDEFLQDNILTFVDTKGRNIKVKDGVLYDDDTVLLDTTNNTFAPVKPV